MPEPHEHDAAPVQASAEAEVNNKRFSINYSFFHYPVEA
jgi:hypothetical protein